MAGAASRLACLTAGGADAIFPRRIGRRKAVPLLSFASTGMGRTVKGRGMDPQDYEFFQQNGYLELGKVLTDEEIARFVEVFDRDRQNGLKCWYLIGRHQFVNCDALVTSPEFDGIIRHPRVLPPVEALMGGPICFSEICIRHMPAYDGEPHQGWHRDRPHWPEHPLRMDYIQLMLYLADVDETTHCFSISPESIDDPMLDTEEQLQRAGGRDLHGPAGSAILFNVSAAHTATTRPTRHERKTVQIYYGHRDRRYLSEDSVIPTAFWRDHPDPEVRAFYGNLNRKTRVYLAALGGGVAHGEDR